MSVTFIELARRLCRANHTVGFATGNTAPQGAPCSEHLVEATRSWGLTLPSGAKSLAVVAEAAGYRLEDALFAEAEASRG